MTKDKRFMLVEWRTAQAGNDWFVIETTPESTSHSHVQYGPMPGAFVLPLISERRAYYTEILKMRSPYLFPPFD